MTFDNTLMILMLAMNGDMDHNITLLAAVSGPLRQIYKDLDTLILFSIKGKNEYQIKIIENPYGPNRRTQIYSSEKLAFIWKILMRLVHKYSIKNPRSYYVEKYFDLSALVDSR